MYQELFTSWADVQKEYGMGEPEPDQVIVAAYKYEDYSGDSLVVYRNDGIYYVVYGSHCSCHGLEEQWQPESLGDKVQAIDYFEKIAESSWGIQQALAPQILKALKRKDKMLTKEDLDQATELMLQMHALGAEIEDHKAAIDMAKNVLQTRQELKDKKVKEYYSLQADLLAITGGTPSYY